MTAGLVLASLIFLSYSIIAVNTCAIAKARYLPTFISSTAFMCVNFFLIRHIAEARSWREFIGYLIGGVSGDLFGIYLSKKWNII
jgi:hypothetical protein